jgi:hypothetical protein
VVEGSGLLSRPPSNRSIGSNPILSANLKGKIMARTNSNFKLSKSTKRVLASSNFKTDEERNHYKKMMIQAEHASSIPFRAPKSRNETPKE